MKRYFFLLWINLYYVFMTETGARRARIRATFWPWRIWSYAFPPAQGSGWRKLKPGEQAGAQSMARRLPMVARRKFIVDP